MRQSFTLTDERVRANCLVAVAQAPIGYEVEIKPKGKTPPQRRYWHNILSIIAKLGGTGYTLDQIKHMIKVRVLGLTRWKDRHGAVYEMVKPSEDCDVEEYNRLIEATKLAADSLGCKIPEPNYYGLQER